MKQKELIYQGNPCIAKLEDPKLQTLADAKNRGPEPCRYYGDQSQCSPPRFGCVRDAASKVARYLIQFYSEATEQTLAMELEEFRRSAPLPPDPVEAYVDSAEFGYRYVTDPDLVVQRVGECARKILDFKPQEKALRSSEEIVFMVDGRAR